jgi:hypothetical protein
MEPAGKKENWTSLEHLASNDFAGMRDIIILRTTRSSQKTVCKVSKFSSKFQQGSAKKLIRVQ